LSKVTGGNVPDLVSAEMLEKIADKLKDLLQDFPEVFKDERWDICWEMWRKSPDDFEDETFATKLKWTEYPGNDMQVNELALKRAANSSLKDLLCEIIHALVDGEIDKKSEELPEIVRSPAKKAADKIIEKAVDKAVDEAIKKIREKIAEKEGEKKEDEGMKEEGGMNTEIVIKIEFKEGDSKPEKMALAKIKAKK